MGKFPIKVKQTGTNRILTCKLRTLTCVDAGTNWCELAVMTDTPNAAYVARLFEKTWLCRFPRPDSVVHDSGPEFNGFEFQKLLSRHGIKRRPTTAMNPRANSPAERLHLMIEDILRIHVFEAEETFEDFDHTIQAIAWAFRTTVPSTTSYSSEQLAFGKDMIFRVKAIVDWEAP